MRILFCTTVVSTACCITMLTGCEEHNDNSIPSRDLVSETTLVSFDFSEDIIVGDTLTIGPTIDDLPVTSV